MARTPKTKAEKELERAFYAVPNAGRDRILLNWIAERLAEQGRTVEQLSRKVIYGGAGPGEGDEWTLRRILLASDNPPKRLPLASAVHISNEINVPISELLTVFGSPLKASVPLWGIVRPDGSITRVSGRSVPSVEIGGDNLCALKYRGGGPWSDALFYFRLETSPAKKYLDRLMVVKATDAAPILGAMLHDPTDGLQALPFGTTRRVSITEIEWSAPVLMIRLAP